MSAAVAPPAALSPTRPTLRHRWRALRARRRARVEGLPLLGRGVVLDVSPGAEVVLGDGCVLLDGCRLHVRGGRVRIEAGAVLGERCALLVHAGADIGRGARLADGVVVCDFEPGHADVERPVRLQPLRADPVTVGDGARVGPGAVLGRGARVRAGASVPAHAVVAAGR